MKHWIVTRKSDGAEVYRYQSDAPIEWAGMEFATHDHTEYVESGQGQLDVPPKPWRITRRAFWNRLPRIKLVSMQSILRGGAPALLAGRLGVHQVFVSDGPYVDLDDPETVEGVNDLTTEAYPLTLTIDGVAMPLRLTVAEAVAILQTPPVVREVWNG